MFKIFNLKSAIRNSSKGFTLIELAVVLVVIGILVALGTSLIGPLTKRSKVIDSREAVKTAKEALSGYAVKYGYLPTTIGPSGGREMDAWGNSLSYAADTSLIVVGTNACNQTSTDRTIFECTNTACTTANQKDNIAFIVYSKGEDGEGTGTTTQPAGGPACPGGTCYWIREQASNYTVGPTTYQYDDIVQYVTLDEIRSLRGCSFSITTNSLPDGKTGVAYNGTGVQLQASGGQTPYTSWATGEAQGACAAGNVRLVASDIGLCLNTTSGLISGTPTTAGVYNFTVTLTDANGVTTSEAFTLNVIDSCFSPGIYVVNTTGATRYYKRNNSSTGGSGCTSWANNAIVNVQPVDILYPFTASGCATRACTASHPAPNYMSYSVLQGTDVNDNCSITWSVYGAANCTLADL